MNREATKNEIVSRWAIIPTYIWDHNREQMYMVWGRYYEYRVYCYDRFAGERKTYKKCIMESYNFVSKKDAQEYLDNIKNK